MFSCAATRGSAHVCAPRDKVELLLSIDMSSGYFVFGVLCREATERMFDGTAEGGKYNSGNASKDGLTVVLYLFL